MFDEVKFASKALILFCKNSFKQKKWRFKSISTTKSGKTKNRFVNYLQPDLRFYEVNINFNITFFQI